MSLLLFLAAQPAPPAAPASTSTRTPSYHDTIVPAGAASFGCVGYWRLNSATTLTDQSPSFGPNGTASNTTLVTGLLQGDTDHALSFNGTTSHCDVPDYQNLDAQLGLTLEAWIKPSSVSGTQTLISKNGQYQLILNGNRLEAVITSSAGAGTFTFPNAASLSSGTVYHVLFALDTYRHFVCINGVISDFGLSSNPPPISTGTNALTLGATLTGSTYSNFLNGTLDEVAVYNYALSEEEALSHYIAGATATPGQSDTVVEVAFGSAAGSDYYSSVTNDGAFLYYRLDDAVGSTSVKSQIVLTLNGTTIPDGVVHGTVTFGQTGALANDADTAALFDGSSGYVTVADTGSNLAFSPLTVESWVNVASLPGSRGFVVDKVGSYAIAILSDGKVQSTLTNGVNLVQTSSVASLVTGAYYHVAITYDGSAMRTYINGILDSTTSYSSGIGANTNDIQLGANGDSSTDFLHGTIDEVAIYDAALSPQRLAIHYASRNIQRPLVWTDISAYVRSYTTSQGKQHELDRYEAATANLVLNNQDRRFEPNYADGPYFPNIVPYKQIRIWEQKDGVRFPVFTGWVERWPEAWQGPSYAETTIDCTDGFDLIAEATCAASLLPSVDTTSDMVESALVTGGNWDADLYPVVRSFVQVAGLAGGVQMNRPASDPVNVLDVCRGAEDTEGGEFYIDRRGRPTFILRKTRFLLQPIVGPRMGDGGYDATGEVGYQDLRPTIDKDRIVNDVQVTAQGGTLQEATDYDSVVANGMRSLQLSTFNTTDADALSLAETLLAREATPGIRIETLSLSEGTATDNARLVQMLVRQVGDKIVVIRRPGPNKTGALMVQTVLISHVQVTKSAPRNLQVVWQLVPQPLA